MKKSIIIGLILILSLSACASLLNSPLNASNGQQPTLNAKQLMEKTLDYYSVQTIIAREQFTSTPTLEKITVATETGTITSAVTPIMSVIATAKNSETAIFAGPGDNSRIICYVDKGMQLTIKGRNVNSSWLVVTFNQGQTCYKIAVNSVRQSSAPDPTMQLWISSTSFDMSGDLTTVPAITPAP